MAGFYEQHVGPDSTVEARRDYHARLMAALGQVPEEALLKIPNPERKQTLLELLLSSAAHDAHHSGQIDYLKGLQETKK